MAKKENKDALQIAISGFDYAILDKLEERILLVFEEDIYKGIKLLRPDKR